MNTQTVRPIAVIGMACRYPGAAGLVELWENVLARRQQFRTMPDVRLPLSDYHDPDPAAPDKTYGRRAALIDGFDFDPVAYRIPKSAFESTDFVHWLALATALEACKHARLASEALPKDTAGVILGNTLTGEDTRTTTLRLRWPFVRKVLHRAARARGLSAAVTADLEGAMERLYKSVFAPITEDTLAGGLANTIAGRICNYLDLHGGGYIVDGACSSSLLAISTAADYLHQGRMDLAIAGGVDVSLDTFELIGFSKATALTRDDMRVYDRGGRGFIPGEGCGMVVLKRFEDARRDGDTVYAVLRGWGVSSDGKGGITAPSAAGQSKALLRAYEAAGYRPQTLTFIEGHGTGTRVGDRAELEGIAGALAVHGPAEEHGIGVTSFKSLVGHTKAASGVGGFIKAVVALNRRIIPPTAGCAEPHAVFGESARPLYPVVCGAIRRPDEMLRAGVSAMGFGGINCHVTLESGDPPAATLEPFIAERALLASSQQTEIIPLSARDRSGLIEAVRAVHQEARGISMAELTDLAAHRARMDEGLEFRAAIVARGPDDLMARLESIERKLREEAPASGQAWRGEHIWIGEGVQEGRVGFLFPGQGSQQLGMARGLVERFDWAASIVAQADAWVAETRDAMGASNGEPLSALVYRPTERDPAKKREAEWLDTLTRTENAQPAICLASMLWMERLAALGIVPVVAGGHSLGELTALAAAGTFDCATLVRIATVRGLAMSAPSERAGTMAMLACGPAAARAILAKAGSGYCTVANYNSPVQTVISGEREAVDRAVETARAEGLQAKVLRVSNAFHSRLVEPAAELIRKSDLVPPRVGSLRARVFSCVGGLELGPERDLREHLADQIVSPVDFVRMAEAVSAHCHWIVEVGPGRVLSGLLSSQDAGHVRPCLPVESHAGGDADLNAVVAEAFTRGLAIRWEALYDRRLVRPFVPAIGRKFFVNPCERELAPIEARTQPLLDGLDAIGSLNGVGESAPDLASLSSRLAAVFADATNAMHAALFLHDEAHDELWIVHPPESPLGSFPAGLGIAGAVFRSGASEIIEVVGDDPRFHPEIDGHDAQAGWTALYVPLVTAPSRKPAGVVRVLRDSRDCFGPIDAHVLSELARAATPALVQAHLHESIREARRIERLLWDLAETRTDDQTLASLLATIVDSAKAMFAAERGSVFLYDRATDELYSLLADTEPVPAPAAGHRPQQIRFPADRGIAGHVLRTKRPVHIANAYADERFNPEVDRTTGFQTRTIDCVPLLTKSGEAIGVIQILNRRFPGDRERFREMGLQAAAMIAHQQLIDELRGTVQALKGTMAGPRPTPGGGLPAGGRQTPPAAHTDAGGSATVRTVLLGLIGERTGFAVDTLADDARLVDDLNLDSIKIGALLADAAIRLGVQGKVDPAGLGGATIGEVVSAFEAAAGPVQAAVSAADVLFQLVMDRTGFGRDMLSPNLRLLDDLNLDSIKAAALLGELALRMKIEGRLDVASLANATVEEIAARVQAVVEERPGSTEPRQTGISRGDAPVRWVRDFVSSVVEMPRPAPRDGWAAGMVSAVLVVADEPRHPVADRLAERIGARVVTRSAIGSTQLPSPLRALVILLPEPDRRSNASATALVDDLSVLHELASRAPERWTELRGVAFVQWTGGRFGLDGTFAGARAFAASLSLERPDLEVRVVDLDSSLEAELAADLVLGELASDGRYRAAGYDRADRCHVPVMGLVDVAEATPREITWSKDDVFLITGGGKGITAECALELARLTGAKLALVGRSQPPTPDDRDSELARVLRRFQDAGIEHRYYAADAADREALEGVLRAVRAELGPVTGVLHGAGTNRPRKVAEVSGEDAKAEIAPKVLGAENLLGLLASSPPKLFAAFTSIIGVTGMMNNAWYAYSNEAVDRMLRRFRTEHPATAVLSYAFSVWEDVGMGVRLGSVQHLRQLGIDAIPVDEGVRHFARWIQKAPPDTELIVMAGATALPTIVREPAAAGPAWRFSGRTVRYEPGVEVVTRVELDTRHDLFLGDHNFRGSLLFPTVMGLEAMAQASLRAAGTPGLEVARIEDVRLERPIVVEPERPAVIEIRALVLERERASDPRAVEASIHTDKTGFGPAHFAARFVLGERVSASEDAVPPSKPAPLHIVPEEDLYGSVLFQGPLFQRLRTIEALDERHVVFTTEARADTVSRPEGFSDEVRAPLVLGDAYYRDTLLQASQLSVTPEVCLPIRIARLEFYEPAHAGSGRCWAEATVTGREDRRIFADVVVRNEAGRLVERLTGYEVKVLERRPDFPSPSDLVDADLRDERLLRREIGARAQKLGLVAPTVVLRDARGLHERPKEERHSIEHPVFRQALERALGESGAATAELGVGWLPSGKPVVISQDHDRTGVIK